MKKKRFIKLLMSLGCSRNLATFFARNDHTKDEYELIKGAITQDNKETDE